MLNAATAAARDASLAAPLSGLYSRAAATSGLAQAMRANQPALRWRGRNIGVSGWTRIRRVYGDRHVPMQVKDPSIYVDPVVITITVPFATLDILGTVTDPGIRVMLL